MQATRVNLASSQPSDASDGPVESPGGVVLGLFPRDGELSPQMAVRQVCRQLGLVVAAARRLGLR